MGDKIKELTEKVDELTRKMDNVYERLITPKYKAGDEVRALVHINNHRVWVDAVVCGSEYITSSLKYRYHVEFRISGTLMEEDVTEFFVRERIDI